MRRHRPLLLLSTALLSWPASTAAQSIPDDTGLTALIQRLGAGNQPTGAGVVVGMTEASAPGYLPDPSHPELAGKTISAMSPGSAVSGHATTVAQHFFGLTTSISPGVDQVEVWEANNWLNNGFLGGVGATPPKTANFKVINHSWIGDGLAPQKSLRKLDWAVERQELVVCVGVNNGTGPLGVPLLSHGFNLIAVGRSDGLHRAGLTGNGIDGPGRHKPEIVAPAGATSFSTPLVSGAAALLVETARTHPTLSGSPAAERADVLKAALLAGATHRAGWTNSAPASGPLRGSTTSPMDDLWGVDQVNVDRSHWILTGGEVDGLDTHANAPPAPHAAWDAVGLESGERRFWRFVVAGAKDHVSVLAAWNRSVATDFLSYEVPDLDLELWRVDAQGQLATLVGDPGLAHFAGGNVRSTSSVENVEHLYAIGLAPGEYALELRRLPDALGSWTAAVAWELDCPQPTAYGAGKTSSQGLSPALGWRGIPNASVDEFVLEVADALAGNNGLVFWGVGQASIPFQGGTLLVQPPVVRMPPVTLDASGAATIPVPLDASLAGLTRNYQFWFRDPAHPDGTGTGLSNAVEVLFCW